MKERLVALGLIVFSLSLVSAFGVSTPYWDDNPLKLAPGESKIVELKLQNMMGEDNVTLKAKITDDGKGIAVLVDSNPIYEVPLGVNNVIFKVNISVPEDYTEGGKRDVRFSFTQVSNEEEGMVTVSGGTTSKMTVLVVDPKESVLYEPEQESEGNFIFYLVILIILIILVVMFTRKNKRPKKRKK